MTIEDSFTRIARWLDTNAPRVRELLLPPVDEATLATFASEFMCAFPPGLAALYRVHGGQHKDARVGLFRGYFFMPIRGVDGLETEWDRMIQKAEARAGDASKELYPFAKDFGGNHLCFDAEHGGRVVELEDNRRKVLAPSMEVFLESVATDLEKGRQTIELDDEEVLETAEVIFDAARPRAPGDVVKHSVFERLMIDARVEALHVSEHFPDPDKHGFAVRLMWTGNEIRVEAKSLVDAAGRRAGSSGHGSGGGSLGMYVFAKSRNPLSEGSRLHVQVDRVRKVTLRAPSRPLSLRFFAVCARTPEGFRLRCPSLDATAEGPKLGDALDALIALAKTEIVESAHKGRVIAFGKLDPARFERQTGSKVDESAQELPVFEYSLAKEDPSEEGPVIVKRVASWARKP